MKLKSFFALGMAGLIFASGTVIAAESSSGSNSSPATAPVYLPDTAHQNEPLPDGILAWNALTQEATLAADAQSAHFTFSFTNISPGLVTILDVHPSCGCTTAQLPSMPWTIPAGSSGQFGLTVNVTGKTGMLFKTVTVKTDKGYKQLILKINMLPPVIPTQSAAEREKAMLLAKTDRQAVFHGDCAVCHVKPGNSKYGKPLYDAVCAICHDSPNRASMVPDLHALKTPTNMEFWKTWISHGKAGSLMPAFATSDGGPLSDMQIASLTQYLTISIQSQPALSK